MKRTFAPVVAIGVMVFFGGYGVAKGQVLFFDQFEQFPNGTDLTSTNYTPKSGPPFPGTLAITSVQSGTPKIKATNFLGSTWAFFHNSSAFSENEYQANLFSVQTAQALRISWKMWIEATNSGNGLFQVSVPVNSPSGTYKPPLVFLDNGVIVILTNGTSPPTSVGNWSSAAGSVMTNILVLDYPGRKLSYELNGQTLATLPLGPNFTNVVYAAYFNGIESIGGSLGNRFAMDDVKVETWAPSALAWTNRFNGRGSDKPTALALDGSNNVIVAGYTGSSYAVIKYSSAGAPLWMNLCEGEFLRDLAIDQSGNILVAGSSYAGGGLYEYAIVAYSSEGLPLWTNRYPAGIDQTSGARAVAVDSDGNILVTGSSSDSGNGVDYATIKYTSQGVPLWTNRYSGPGNNSDEASDVGVDTNGNVFVTGYSTFAGNSISCLTVAYSSTGSPLWTNSYGGTGSAALAVDSGGNVFVTGASTGSGSSYDYVTVKYSGLGGPLWTNRYNGPANNIDIPQRLAVDSGNNVFVTGQSWGGSFFDDDYATIKYSNLGVPLWTNRYNGPGNGSDVATALAGDSSGTLFVTGYSYASGFVNSDYATIAYSSAGVALWTNRYNGPKSDNDIARAVAVDSDGNVYVTGESWIGNDSDYATIKYSGGSVPSLTVFRSATNMLTVSWPVSLANFRLQQNSNSGSANWTSVGTAPVTNGPMKTVAINPSAGPRNFYRLIYP